MLCHYLKVAFRSFAKYKQQTIISIVGLAVGFVCFALAVMWIRYERSFDKFHPGYERIFAVVRVDEKDERGISTNTPRPLSQKLKELFPEIEEACSTSYFSTNMFAFNDREVQLNKVEADSNFFKLFRKIFYIISFYCNSYCHTMPTKFFYIITTLLKCFI